MLRLVCLCNNTRRSFCRAHVDAPYKYIFCFSAHIVGSRQYYYRYYYLNGAPSIVFFLFYCKKIFFLYTRKKHTTDRHQLKLRERQKKMYSRRDFFDFVCVSSHGATYYTHITVKIVIYIYGSFFSLCVQLFTWLLLLLYWDISAYFTVVNLPSWFIHSLGSIRIFFRRLLFVECEESEK